MNENLNQKQTRFQLNNIPNRLGHIAANLARIKSFSQIAYKEAVKSVISETKWFIEWTAAEIEPVQAEELVNIKPPRKIQVIEDDDHENDDLDPDLDDDDFEFDDDDEQDDDE